MKNKKVNWLIIDDKKNQELLPIEDTIKIIRKSTKLSIKSPEMIQDRQKDDHRIRVFKDKSYTYIKEFTYFNKNGQLEKIFYQKIINIYEKK